MTGLGLLQSLSLVESDLDFAVCEDFLEVLLLVLMKVHCYFKSSTIIKFVLRLIVAILIFLLSGIL